MGKRECEMLRSALASTRMESFHYWADGKWRHPYHTQRSFGGWSV